MSVEEQREQIANRLGEPDRLQFPDGWTFSSSWRRAQAAPSTVGAVNPAEFDVLLGYVDDDGLAKHRVSFAIYAGDAVGITEYPDDRTIEQVRLAFESNGTHHAESYRIFDPEEHLEMVEELG